MPKVTPEVRPQLSDVRAVARLLDCSPRHVYRLSDSGLMPPPVKLGHLVRWNRTEIEEWITAGCPPCRYVPTRRMGGEV